MEIVGYVTSVDEFFITPCCINCSVEEHCLFSDANRILGMKRMYEKELVDMEEKILISESVVVERGLREDKRSMCFSLSSGNTCYNSI